jgi:hypothetical protein
MLVSQLQMAPLLDFSITGIQASLHGRLEALSATVNCSLTATTYNSKFDVWEPLVEPCTAFIRLGLLNINQDLCKFGKRIYPKSII